MVPLPRMNGTLAIPKTPGPVDPELMSAINPVYSYQALGTYTVSLKVTDNLGSTDSTSQEIRITQLPRVIAVFGASTNGREVTFKDASYADSEIVRRTWDFGDGTDTITRAQTDTVFTYTYPASDGEFLATLTIEDAENNISTRTERIRIVAEQQSPDVDFSIIPRGRSVQFTNLSENTTTPLVTWDFGDGSTSDLNSLTHTYTEPGLYAVRLTVVNDGGEGLEGRMVKVVRVEANEPPEALFSVVVGEPVQFQNDSRDPDSEDGPKVLRWRFWRWEYDLQKRTRNINL